ncbi:OLC1v1007035C1 [Oldenlandia corymbosa var. corymbosa]|uniref:OLC1v1007035C1 n=1 Tax=Oldenlandia corymbosa var. corymbosa TaxID=529605 RepID=A0AAV1DL27_OLDCO|nr:OLC1v1007035C1 [Oldenlandia corymbosa var. corymbosa]
MPEEERVPSMAIAGGDSSISLNDSESEHETSEPGLPSPDGQETREPTRKETKISSQKSLLEFRCKVEDAILGNYIYGGIRGNAARKKENLQEITLWGVPLLPSKGHPGTDVVLMKFLKAKDYKVPDAFSLLCKMMKWRKDFKVDGILNEKMCPEFGNMWRINGADKEGRPLCYLSFRDLQNKELKRKLFRADGKLEEFLRWRIQCIEKAIRELDFGPGGATCFFQVTDFKNSPVQSMGELRWICRKMLNLFRDNYPGILHKNVIANVPLWNIAVNAINLRQITAKSKNKLIFVRSAKVTKTLLKYVNPENLLAQFGGLKRENDLEFSALDKVIESNVRANTVDQIKIPANEVERTVTWDVAIVGNEVTYQAEFIPLDDCSYTVLLEKEKRIGKAVRNSFYIREPGNIVITIGNGTFKRRKVFYRYSSKPYVPVYMITK